MLQTILTVLQVLVGIAIVVIVLLQSGKKAGLSGAIAGGSSETFMSKNKGKSLDAKLAGMTKWFGLAFVVLTVALNIV